MNEVSEKVVLNFFWSHRFWCPQETLNIIWCLHRFFIPCILQNTQPLLWKLLYMLGKSDLCVPINKDDKNDIWLCIYEHLHYTYVMLSKNFIESINLVWNYMQVHVFNVLAYSGEPCETEEMSPQWFSHDEIPFGMLVFLIISCFDTKILPTWYVLILENK